MIGKAAIGVATPDKAMTGKAVIADVAPDGSLAAALLHAAQDAVLVMSADGIIVAINPSTERILGYRPAEAIGRMMGELLVPESQRERVLSVFQRHVAAGAAEGLEERIETEVMRADGSLVPVEMTMAAADVAIGRLITAQLRDLTEHRRILAEAAAQRERMRGLGKLSALGTLLSGVSHELNNPLSIILAQSTLLLEKARDPDIRRRAERIYGASERCSRILKSFMAMPHQKPRSREVVSIGDIVRDSLELTAYGRRSAGIEAKVSIADGLGAIECDRDLIGHAVSHLLVFAQGRLMAVGGARLIAVTVTAGDGFLLVEVADNGPDVPDSIVPRLFDPFAPTDPSGAGIGIGLHLARDAAESHGGRLIHARRDGGGAALRMFLPMAAAQHAAAVPDGGSHPAAVRRRAILIVDDEREVGNSLAELVDALGYATEVMENPDEALQRLARRRYDAVISDYRMPGKDGRVFLAAVVAADPAMRGRCILATGDVLGVERVIGDGSADDPILLPKPFSLVDVGLVLNRIDWAG